MEWNKVAADILWSIEHLQDEDYALQSDSTYYHRILTENVEARQLLAHVLEGPFRPDEMLDNYYDADIDYDVLLTEWCRNNAGES